MQSPKTRVNVEVFSCLKALAPSHQFIAFRDSNLNFSMFIYKLMLRKESNVYKRDQRETRSTVPHGSTHNHIISMDLTQI